jgi:hypothetical protein
MWAPNECVGYNLAYDVDQTSQAPVPGGKISGRSCASDEGPAAEGEGGDRDQVTGTAVAPAGPVESLHPKPPCRTLVVAG